MNQRGRHRQELRGQRFTSEDHEIVRRELKSLSDEEFRTVFLCFWESMEREEAARELGLSRVRVDQILVSAFSKLRERCLREPQFSRSLNQVTNGSAQLTSMQETQTQP